MDNPEYKLPGTLHVDGGWYDAYWLRRARADAARSIVQYSAAWAAGFGRWAANVAWARDAIADLPAERDSCVQGDEVARAKWLLLGQ